MSDILRVLIPAALLALLVVVPMLPVWAMIFALLGIVAAGIVASRWLDRAEREPGP